MRVLVVDDSTIFRKVVRDALAAEPGVEVVGVAADGRRALEKIDQLQPDLVTLDVEMPELDGLGVLRELHGRSQTPTVIMLSSLTASGAVLTAQSLRLGAFDFILKPGESSLERNVQVLRAELGTRLQLLAARRSESSGSSTAAPNGRASKTNAAEPAQPAKCIVLPSAKVRPRVIAIGVSTGGPAALAKLLPNLPASLPVPVVLVQHMPPMFTKSLAEDLDRSCALSVREATHGDVLQAGTVYIAPGGRQMKIISPEGRPRVEVTDDPPERGCRPSVDYMFRSVSEVYGPSVLAIVLTGMGDDGAAGCRALKQRGARVVAQDQASCVVYGMPRQVVEAGLADIVCPLGEIDGVIQRSLDRGAAS